MSAEQETPLKAIQVKLVLLGEAAVGKSSLVLRFVSNDFNENNSPTIGAAFLTQKCRLEDKVIKFEIWDTAGQERFHSLAPMYYRNAAAAVVVYDVTKAASLEKAKAWVKELQRQASPNIIIALVGNKLDLVSGDAPGLTDPQAEAEAEAEADAEDDEDEASTPTAAASANVDGETQRQVPTSEAAAYAKESGLLFFEASAKLGTNVQEVFTEIAKTIKVESVLNKNAPAAGANGGATRRTAGASAAQDGVNLDQGLGAKVRGGCC